MISVDVMNYFFFTQWPAKFFFHDNSVRVPAVRLLVADSFALSEM